MEFLGFCVSYLSIDPLALPAIPRKEQKSSHPLLYSRLLDKCHFFLVLDSLDN